MYRVSLIFSVVLEPPDSLDYGKSFPITGEAPEPSIVIAQADPNEVAA